MIDYVTIVHVGDSDFKVGDHMEKHEIEKLNADDSLRAGYYARNKEFIAVANPLETCLTEDPIQVMFSGTVAPIREIEAALRAAPLAEDFALAVTIYAKKDFAMIDVIHPACSKGSSLAEWAAQPTQLPDVSGAPRAA